MPKISALTAAGSITSTDVVPVVQGGVTVKMLAEDVGGYVRTAEEIAAGVTPSTGCYKYAPGDIRRYGALTGLANVSATTTALQNALTANSAGRVYIPPGQWYVSSTVTVEGRTLVEGDGIVSEIVFRPTVNGDTLFTATNRDNMTFRDFTVNGNAGTATGKTAFQFDATNSRIMWDNVYFDTIDYRCIQRTNAEYDIIQNCRFLNTDYSAVGGEVGVAIYIGGYGNRLSILGCRFALNDMCIRVESGNAVRIEGNSFEQDGDSGNAAISSQVYLSSVRGTVIHNNYVEAERTASGAGVFRLDDCTGVSIDGNMMDGSVGGTTYSDSFFDFNGACEGITIRNNDLREILNYFIRSFGITKSIKAHSNVYYDGSAQITTYNGIMAKMGSPTLVELDIPHSFTNDFANLADGAGATASSAVTGLLLGDLVQPTISVDLQDAILTGYVQANGTAEVRLQNESTAAVDLASATVRLFIRKAA